MERAFNQNEQWSIVHKLIFRFAFIFFLLFILLENNGAFPFWGIVLQFIEIPLQPLISWVGLHLLHIHYPILQLGNGSGDTTYDYVLVFTIFLLAIVTALIWSVIGRKATNYTKLNYYFTVLIRYYLGLILISYGLYKVFKLQFPEPGLYRLTETYGDSSPMGLAWAFLGFSKGYNMFMGIAELTGILLLFRRTVTLGAVIGLMTTANVMAINYYYDVPVKIISTALVVMCIILLLPNAKNLSKFFFTNETVSQHISAAPVIRNKWLRIGKGALKFFLIAFPLVGGSIEAIEAQKAYGDNAPKAKLYGLYESMQFVSGRDTLTGTDGRRWKKVMIESDEFLRITYANDSLGKFYVTLDTNLRTILLTGYPDTNKHFALAYTRPQADQLLLQGQGVKDSVSVLLKRTVQDKDKFILMNRGFHWINESPYNR